jgi:hypothetical protein
MALSAPPNYQQEAKEVPLYGDIDSEEETPKSIPRAKEGTPPSSDSRSGESKSPDGGSATSEGEPGEDYSGLALTQLGSTSTLEHITKEIQFGGSNLFGRESNFSVHFKPLGPQMDLPIAQFFFKAVIMHALLDYPW